MSKALLLYTLVLLLLFLFVSSSLCLIDQKEETHPDVFYKEDYVSADYDPTANLTDKPNSLFKTKNLVFDYSTNPKELHGKSRRGNKHNDESLKRTKREASGNSENIKTSNRQKRQYYQQQYQYNPFINLWNHKYNNYYETQDYANNILYPPTYYLPVENNHPNKIPIRGIYHNPISVPGKPSINPKPQFNVGIRFGEEDYFEDRPVWGVRYEKPPPPRSQLTTRRPPTTVSTPPPLLHGIGRTQPPLLHGRPHDNSPPSLTVNNQQENKQPVTPAQPITTPEQLSKCVWAIVSCCSRDTLQIRYDCFEQLKCTGAFWGLNPCANEVQNSAIDVANNYYS